MTFCSSSSRGHGVYFTTTSSSGERQDATFELSAQSALWNGISGCPSCESSKGPRARCARFLFRKRPTGAKPSRRAARAPRSSRALPLPSGRLPEEGNVEFRYESCYLREMRHFVDAVRGRGFSAWPPSPKSSTMCACFTPSVAAQPKEDPSRSAELSGLRASL